MGGLRVAFVFVISYDNLLVPIRSHAPLVPAFRSFAHDKIIFINSSLEIKKKDHSLRVSLVDPGSVTRCQVPLNGLVAAVVPTGIEGNCESRCSFCCCCCCCCRCYSSLIMGVLGQEALLLLLPLLLPQGHRDDGKGQVLLFPDVIEGTCDGAL